MPYLIDAGTRLRDITEPRTDRAVSAVGAVGAVGAGTAVVIAVASVWRNLPLLFASRPRTPLRVLCIMAFDAVARGRGDWLSATTKQTMIATLDLGACLNDYHDEGHLDREEYRATRRSLAACSHMGLHDVLRDYRHQLRALETNRPPLTVREPHRRACRSIRAYRESVVQLSLGALAAAAFGGPLADGIRSIRRDIDLAILFRIVMLTQILDDLFDWNEDLRLELPTFMTMQRSGAAERGSHRQKLNQVRRLAADYSVDFPLTTDRLFPQRLALHFLRRLIDAALLWRATLAPPRKSDH